MLLVCFWRRAALTSKESGSADELLRQYVHAGDARDYSALKRLLDANVLTHSPGGVETIGIDGQIAAWSAAHKGLEELRHEVRDVVARGNTAAARIRVSGVHNGQFLGVDATGARVDVDQALFVRIESGRIAEMWEVVDTGSGLRQIGVIKDQILSPGA